MSVVQTDNESRKNERQTIVRFDGLSHTQARQSLINYGENSIYRRKRLRPFVAFLKKFNSPLLLLLIGASLVSFFLGQRVNASIILFMVFLSAILDFVNSHKSERVAEKLVSQVSSTATVWREGKKEEIPFRLIVPDDIVELSAGDVIPADCRVVTADDFFVNQSALTGESFPVEKRVADPSSFSDDQLSLSDDTAVFMGTSVVTGFATVRVVHTGARAEFGKIADKLAAAEEETSFDIGLKNFSTFIIKLTFALVIVVFGINAYMERGVLDSLLFAIAIAVGLTPELLPVIMSVALSHGSLIMAKKHVVVKNLSAVQNFGGMNILCTDKTGTLTEDRIELVKCVDITGALSDAVLRHTYLSSIFHTARKSPLDTAVQTHGKMDVSNYKKVDEIPFDFDRRRDSIVVSYEGKRFMITKGAPESILEISTHSRTEETIVAMDHQTHTQALGEFHQLSADGFRVLAVALKELPNEERVIYQREEEKDMIFIGFAAFLDPPKESAGKVLKELRDLAVDVKIITGDSDVLTLRICRDLAVDVKGVMVGDELAKISDSELARKASDITVFARVSPEQKERIVRILRKSGNTVGYLGDGINDAPVLKAADVGISVNNAVDVAKETADIILLRKSLHVLKDGVVEGRKTFQNTLKYIKMGFSSNFGNMFSMVAASIFLPFLPMLPAQILLNNFLYDMSQTTLPTDHTDHESTAAPLVWNMHDFTKYIIVFGVVSSLFDFMTFFVLYGMFRLSEPHFQAGWFIESIATQILIVFIVRTKRVPFFKSKPSLFVIASAVGVVVFAWLIPFTPIGEILSFAPLSPLLLVTIAGIVFLYLVAGEITKYFFYRAYRNAP